MTNYEKIKSMSVEEMAEFLGDTPEICDFCVYEGSCHNNLNTNCIDGTKLWLEQEAEE